MKSGLSRWQIGDFMASLLKILMVEDDQNDAELVKRELKRAGLEFEARQVQTREKFLQELDSFEPDIILCDFTLPNFDAMTAIELSRQRKREVPLIVVTGSLSEEAAVEFMLNGASDYVLKEHLTKLGPAVRRTMERKGEHDAKSRAEEELLEKIRKLSDFNQLMVGREERVIELKNEVNALLAELGRPPKYL